MNIKDKVAICLTILIVILFGWTLNKLAYDITDVNLDGLANEADQFIDNFIGRPASSLHLKTISPGNYNSGYYRSGLCMYHPQSNNENRQGYKIVDVLDFQFSNYSGLEFIRNGQKIDTSLNTDRYTATLAKTVFEAYSNYGPGTWIGEHWGTTDIKEKITYAFSQAIYHGGMPVDYNFYSNIRDWTNENGDNEKDRYFKGWDTVDTSYGRIINNYLPLVKYSADSGIIVQHDKQSGYTMIGPFNVSYKKYDDISEGYDSLIGIKSISIASNSKQITAESGGNIYYSAYYRDLNNVQEWINDTNGCSNALANIPSGKEFFIIVADGDEGFYNGDNLTVSISQQPIDYYRARIVLARNPAADGQNMAIYAGKLETYQGGQQVFYIPKGEREPQLVGLSVIKSGSNNVKQANVNFYLTSDAGIAHWGSKEDQNGITVYSNITFKGWEDDETRVFTTGASGQFIVKDIDSAYVYSLQETYNDNEGYREVVDIKNAYLTNGNHVSLGNTDANNYDTNNVVRNIKLSTQGDNVLEVIDKEQERFADLTVVKSGKDNIKQANVNFYLTCNEGIAHWGSKEDQNGITVYSNITFKGWDDEETRVFTTGSSGKFVIKGISTSKIYALQETYNANEGYSVVDIKTATLSNGNEVSLENTGSETNKNIIKNITLSSQGDTLDIVDRKDNDGFSINLRKVKLGTTQTPVSKAKFKIRVVNHGWLAKNGQGYDYEADFNSAEEWTTPEIGSVLIQDLNVDYEYEIFETYSPYDLSKQPGHAKVTIGNNDPVILDSSNYYTVKGSNDKKVLYCGTVSREHDGYFINVKVANYIQGRPDEPSAEYLYIDGKIWVDEPQKGTYDDLYNGTSEKLYQRKVKISLINYTSGKTISSTSTNNGSYSIDTKIKVTSSTSKDSVAKSLEGYYLKFEYETSYTENKVKYMVTLSSPNTDEKNGSKASLQDSTNNQDGAAYIYNLSEYVEKFYSYKNLSDMNMGLRLTKVNDFDISQDIAYVKVVMNGYTYTYNYRGTGDNKNTAAPTVSLGNGKYGYERKIYPSDIAYNKENENSLKIYVVYKINIKNQNNTNFGKKKKETNSVISYVEVGLKATELYNQYDAKRYEIEKKYDSNECDGDFKNWKEDGTGKVKYTGNKLNNLITSNGGARTVYIQFKVTQTALNDLLNRKVTTEDKPTTATTTAYHEYWSSKYKSYYTYEWNGFYTERKLKWRLEILDHTTDKTTQTASANYLGFNIGTERTITGRVFKDKNIKENTGEIVGDGMYSQDEQTVKKVKVELLTKNGNHAKIYNSANKYESINANAESGNDGTYSFVGVTPGKYIVRFTYGDGTQRLCNLDGTEYKETDTEVELGKYKSTIVTDEAAKNALGYNNNSGKDNEWYKKVKKDTYSVATDNLAQRAEYNKNKQRTNIEANTALMDVSVENTKEDSATVTKSDNGTREKISGMNLGIIEIPEISLAFDKVINNVQITNSQGNIIADGNPATQNLKIVNDLDKSEHLVKGSTYVKSEIAENELYGSTLRLTYAITVQNNSNVNYYEKDIDEKSYLYGYYYKFGENNINGVSTEVSITVENVLDCLDPLIKYEKVDASHTGAEVKVADSSNKGAIEKIQEKTNLTYTTVYDIIGWKSIYSTKGSHSKEETQDTATLQASRLLSSQDSDMSVSNVAQITKIKVTNEPKLVETIDPSDKYIPKNPTDEVYATVTPPTGLDKTVVIKYAIVAVISGIVITLGIIFIKKKVL